MGDGVLEGRPGLCVNCDRRSRCRREPKAGGELDIRYDKLFDRPVRAGRPTAHGMLQRLQGSGALAIRQVEDILQVRGNREKSVGFHDWNWFHGWSD